MEPSYRVEAGKLLLSRREFARWWRGGVSHSYIVGQVQSGYLPEVAGMLPAMECWTLLNRRRRSYGRRPYPWPVELDEIYLDLSR